MSLLIARLLPFAVGVLLGFSLFSLLIPRPRVRPVTHVDLQLSRNDSLLALSANSSSSTAYDELSSNTSLSLLNWASSLLHAGNNRSLASPWSSLFASKTDSVNNSTFIFDSKRQQAPHEKDWLKLHMCNEPFEAYGAAWLSTKQHLIAVNNSKYNLTWVMVFIIGRVSFNPRR